MPVGRRVEHDARVLPGPRGEHDDARLLHLLFLLGVKIFDAGDALAVRRGEDARHR